MKTRTTNPTLLMLVALAVAVHLGSATWNVRHGALNADEGFYAIGTRSVAHGEMPYRDFGFTQPPLILYANALPLRLIGFGLFEQRALNGLWAAGALALASGWLGRRARPAWGVGLALLFSLSAPWMYFIHLGKTYGLTTLLVMLAAWVFLARPPGLQRNLALGLLLALGVGTRLPAAPFFAVLSLLALWPGRRPTLAEVGAMVGSAALTGVCIALPFWLASAQAVKFWVLDFHRLSVPYKDWHLAWQDLVTLAPAVWALAATATVLLVVRRRMATREAGVMLAAALTLGFNLLPGGVYEEYGVPFLLPLAVASAAVIFDGLPARNRAVASAVAVALACVQFLAAPLVLHSWSANRESFASVWLTPHAPPYNPLLPTELAAARRTVLAALPADMPFIGPNIILAAETGRSVPPDLRMGPFSFTVEIPPATAARLHLATHEELDQWFARPDVTLLGFFKRRELNYGWSMPTFGELEPEFHAQWFAPIRRDFATVYESGDDFVLMVRRPAR